MNRDHCLLERDGHVLTVTLRPNVAGDMNRVIRVQTDIKNGGDIEFQTMANIVP